MNIFSKMADFIQNTSGNIWEILPKALLSMNQFYPFVWSNLVRDLVHLFEDFQKFMIWNKKSISNYCMFIVKIWFLTKTVLHFSPGSKSKILAWLCSAVAASVGDLKWTSLAPKSLLAATSSALFSTPRNCAIFAISTAGFVFNSSNVTKWILKILRFEISLQDL